MPHNICIDWSAKQLRGLVPAALRASAPGHAGRWADRHDRPPLRKVEA
jgi:hypothetical protein